MVQETEEPLRPIRYRLKKHTAPPLMLSEHATEDPARSPSEWFSRKFPAQAERYGPPILESVETLLDQSTRITPVALNEDFLAAVLGGDKRLGHDLVYYEPDGVFYYLDHREGCYVSTTEEKLKTLLSQYLIHCADEMPECVDIQRLFIDLRADDNLKRIVKKARSLLAAEESFFSVESGNVRNRGPEFHGRLAKMFTREVLAPSPSDVLTVSDCYQTFNQFCATRGTAPIDRRYFKELIAEVIREEFNLGLRNDLHGRNHRQQQGWKGLSARIADPVNGDITRN